MTSKNVFITNGYEETITLGRQFAKNLTGKNFLAFYGHLGSGKTTFIQGLAMGLGIKSRIISPTFVIIRSHKLNPSAKRQNLKLKMFYHVDLYRTEIEEDLLSVGLDEIIKNKNNIVAVEWSEKMGRLLPQKRIDLDFEYLGDNKRKITINYI